MNSTNSTCDIYFTIRENNGPEVCFLMRKNQKLRVAFTAYHERNCENIHMDSLSFTTEGGILLDPELTPNDYNFQQDAKLYVIYN